MTTQVTITGNNLRHHNFREGQVVTDIGGGQFFGYCHDRMHDAMQILDPEHYIVEGVASLHILKVSLA